MLPEVGHSENAFGERITNEMSFSIPDPPEDDFEDKFISTSETNGRNCQEPCLQNSARRRAELGLRVLALSQQTTNAPLAHTNLQHFVSRHFSNRS